MKKIFKHKRILYWLLPVLALGFIAGIPVDENKTLLEQLIAAFPSEKVSEEQQQNSEQSLNDVWDEMEKISKNNGDDTVTMSGKIRLSDNLDEAGINEEQNFIIKQAGINQWFHLDSFDRVQYNKTLFLINHAEKEVVLQPTDFTDSLMETFRMMDPKKFKKMLIKDGATAAIEMEGDDKMLTIVPGQMDAVNRYEIIYDTANYRIKKFRIYYTSVPYQDYLENDTRLSKTEKKIQLPKSDGTEEEAVVGDEIEANVTEYMVEFDITVKEKSCDMDFLDNQFYKIKNGEDIEFTGKLSSYKKIRNED